MGSFYQRRVSAGRSPVIKYSGFARNDVFAIFAVILYGNAISSSTWATSQVVIANNLLGDPSDNNSWTAAVAPQNSGPDSAEGIEDVIVENNRFERGPNTNTEVILVGRRMTTRGNRRMDSGAVNINQGPSYELLPPEWQGPYYVQ